ncbi:MAG TPA: nucleotidyltransferase domain-containing protein, partial [Burkholderiales bacterium]|nr:nucleotidyltransferase domain-containing protein [Burkholderiales bacterium]
MSGVSVTSSPRLAPLAGEWKRALAQERERLRREFFRRPAAGRLLVRHSQLIDRQLCEVWVTQALPRDWALLAVGGYGRGQLFPSSDIDLLVLLSRAADDVVQKKLEAFIGALWDIGLEVGHSVRTIDECAQLAAQDLTVQTSLLEARVVRGDRKLFRRFLNRLNEALEPADFLQAKQLEQQQRHARYQESNLEPNIKESAGGLRDLQTILWIARAADSGKTWGELARRGVITSQEAREIQRHEVFLQSLRIRLHYLAGRREDRLIFDYQSALATQLSLHDRPHRLASEQLMQRYYRAAKAVSELNAILLQNLKARISPSRDKAYHAINSRFGTRDELLEACNEDLFEREPSAMLEAIRVLQHHHELKGIGATTLRALWQARRHINPGFRRDPVNRRLFIDIMRSPSHVERALRRMNQSGILGRYLPAFGRIVG